jgi:hypothetical protein
MFSSTILLLCLSRYSTSCDICPNLDGDEGDGMNDAGAELFSKLALNCPHADLIIPSCPTTGAGGEKYSASSGGGGGDDGMEGGAVALTVIAVLTAIGAGIAVVLYSGGKNTSRETLESTEGTPAEDAVIT